MTGEDLEKIKLSIMEKIEELKGNIRYLAEETKPVEPGCAIGKQGRIEMMVGSGVDGILLDSSRKRLIRLENALKRIDSGTYGFCIRCNNEISRGRLEAVPEVLLCISCADKRTK